MKTKSIVILLFLSVILILTSCLSSTSAGAGKSDQDDSDAADTSGSGTSDEPRTVSGEFWTAPEGRAPRFIFVHHSTGSGFMFNGGMADDLEEAGFEVHSRTYGDGWVGDNTDPRHFPTTFTRHFDDLITWDLPRGEQYDIIAFKSCYPASNICDDSDLDDYMEWYETVREVTREHPQILFVAMSTPPLTPDNTEPDCAERAREFNDWLMGEFTEGETNLVAYPLFDVLAGDDPSEGDYNCLRYEYQDDPYNSHPNHRANVAVAEDFTEWLSRLCSWDI